MKKIIYLLAALCLFSVAILSGCGGATTNPNPVTTTIYSDGSKDGYVQMSNKDGNAAVTNQVVIKVGGKQEFGDLLRTVNYNWTFRAFLHFNINELANKKIKKAVLSLYHYQTFDKPWDLGALYLDRLDYGSILDVSCFERVALQTITMNLTNEHIGISQGWESIDITELITNSVNEKRNSCQLRIRRNKGHAFDREMWDLWYSGDAAAEYRPKLVVTYQ